MLSIGPSNAPIFRMLFDEGMGNLTTTSTSVSIKRTAPWWGRMEQ